MKIWGSFFFQTRIDGGFPPEMGLMIGVYLFFWGTTSEWAATTGTGNFGSLQLLDLGGMRQVCGATNLAAFVQELEQYLPRPGAFCTESTLAARIAQHP